MRIILFNSIDIVQVWPFLLTKVIKTMEFCSSNG